MTQPPFEHIDWSLTKDAQARNWDELAYLIRSRQMIYIGREEINYSGLYAKEKLMLAEFASKSDWYWCNFLNIASEKCPETNKKKAVIPNNMPRKICIAENDYSYWLTEDIKHFVLWSTHPLEEDQLCQEVVSWVPEGFEYLVGVQQKMHRGEAGVFHAHIFIREHKSNDSQVNRERNS